MASVGQKIIRGLQDAIKGRTRKTQLCCPHCGGGLWKIESGSLKHRVVCLRCPWNSQRLGGEPGAVHPLMKLVSTNEGK